MKKWYIILVQIVIPYAIAVDLGETFKPCPVTDMVTEVEIVATYKRVKWYTQQGQLVLFRFWFFVFILKIGCQFFINYNRCVKLIYIVWFLFSCLFNFFDWLQKRRRVLFKGRHWYISENCFYTYNYTLYPR